MSDPDYFIACCECGMRFSMPKSMNDWYREDARRWFYCPKGHRQHYGGGESDIDAMRRERDRLKQQAARLEDERRQASELAASAMRSASAYKGAATRMKNRAKAGVCPCCNRTFQDLARHMATKHSDVDLSNIVEFGQEKSA